MYKYFFEENNLTKDEYWQAFSLMPAERQQRILRYRREQDRINGILVWKMLCQAMKQEYGIDRFDIAYEKYGKPYLIDYPNIYFNLSHCTGACVCAVGDQPIGIDVQNVVEYIPSIARLICSDGEQQFIEQSLKPDYEFTKIWTIKESFVKMTGRGIGGGLQDVDALSIGDKIELICQNNYCIAIAEKGKIEGI